jgi:hypothetical protein
MFISMLFSVMTYMPPMDCYYRRQNTDISKLEQVAYPTDI